MAADEQPCPSHGRDAMTMAQLDRTMVAFTENVTAHFLAITTRLDGMDKAADILHADLVRVPTLLDRETKALRELLETKISAGAAVTQEQLRRVEVLIEEGEKRNQQLKAGDALALAAALQAAKEAVAEQNRSNTLAISKSETAVGESIRQLQVNFETANKATNEKVDDLKGRLDRGEGDVVNERRGVRERRLDMGTVIAAIAVVIAIGAAVIQLHK